MRARDELQTVVVVELLRDILPERVPGASRAHPPPGAIVGIAPHQITHRSFVRNFREPIDLTHVIQRVDRRRQATVRAEYLILDHRRQRHEIKKIGKRLPNSRVSVLPHALVVKPVHLRDLSRLVIPTNDRHPIRIPHLERDDQRHRLHRVIPAIDVIPQKQIIRIGRQPSHLEHLHHVVKLSVYVPHHRHRRSHELHVALLRQQPARSIAQRHDLLLGQKLVLQQRAHHRVVIPVLARSQSRHRRALARRRAARAASLATVRARAMDRDASRARALRRSSLAALSARSTRRLGRRVDARARVASLAPRRRSTTNAGAARRRDAMASGRCPKP